MWSFQNQSTGDERANADFRENFLCVCTVGLRKEFPFMNLILIMVFYTLRKW